MFLFQQVSTSEILKFYGKIALSTTCINYTIKLYIKWMYVVMMKIRVTFASQVFFFNVLKRIFSIAIWCVFYYVSKKWKKKLLFHIISSDIVVVVVARHFQCWHFIVGEMSYFFLSFSFALHHEWFIRHIPV